MRKHAYRHTGVHKNLARLDFIKSFSPESAAKLRQMLEDNKAKEKGK